MICAQFVAQHREVIIQFLHGYLRIDLRGLNVRMPQNTADALDWHPFAESQGRKPMP